MSNDGKTEKLRATLEASAPLLARREEPLPFFPFYPQDFLFATRFFTREERALYFELLCYQWMHGSLPIELDQLAALLAVKPSKFERIWAGKLRSKFVQLDGKHYSIRLEQERIKSLRRSRKLPASTRSESESGDELF